jgi:decaprenylphospho-beta-D-erythro-pentofuranosid-2-ulose 2-reductase
MKMKGQTILIVGATSSLARAFAAQVARDGANLVLCGRNQGEVERIALDLSVRFCCQTAFSPFEARATDEHEAFFNDAVAKFGSLEGMFVAVGELGDQKEAEREFGAAKSIIESNYLGVVSLLTHAGNYFEGKRRGFIAAVGSVAGDRGRQSNYVYGSAKAGLATYLSGLRNRLTKSNVQVITVKPGFLDTKMTFGKAGLFLVASPNQAAQEVYRGIERQCSVIYVPSFWRLVMLIIRSIPERVFVQMKL